MSTSESCQELIGRSVRPELPHLRRFARAITGDQCSADLCVVLLIDDITKGVDFLSACHNPRVALYQRLLKIMESDAADSNEHPTHPSTALLTPRARQAYLLTAVERFSQEAAAEILSVSHSEFCLLLEAAKNETREQANSNILIIEDEAFISLDLEAIVGELGHRVTGCARTHKEAVAEINRQLPDLILSDVQLADGSSGVEAIDEILTKADIPVIFITAYPDRLLLGKRGEPAFIIAKPYGTAAVKATISQALFLDRTHPSSTRRRDEAISSVDLR
jgi:CheY-like chemotaxis protein